MELRSFGVVVEILAALPNIKELIAVDADPVLPRNKPIVSVPYTLTFQKSERGLTRYLLRKYFQSVLTARDDLAELFESREWPAFKAANAQRIGENDERDEAVKCDIRNRGRKERKEYFLRRWLNCILKVLHKGNSLPGLTRKLSNR